MIDDAFAYLGVGLLALALWWAFTRRSDWREDPQRAQLVVIMLGLFASSAGVRGLSDLGWIPGWIVEIYTGAIRAAGCIIFLALITGRR